ncbi:MAG: PrgI family protein [Candidatus Shapirobacteria bacterium]|nr:PrgI family protein [Candidatus Shapirobacteria bacterium]
MDQHPVPQNIASYEFRLIGDMTLKQFAQLAAGAILGLLIYALPIPSLFKWPLIIFFGFSGFALAFLPLNERPLSTWVLAFFKAIFLPTQFVWEKTSQKPEMFEPIIFQTPLNKAAKYTADKKTLNQYLATLPYSENKNPLDQQEESFLKEIGNLFQLVHPFQPIPISTPPSVPKPKLNYSFTPPPRTNYQPLQSRPVSNPPKPLSGKVILPQQVGRPRKPIFEAKMNPALLIPTPPTRPNIIVGMVLDNEGKIIDGAILEIRN